MIPKAWFKCRASSTSQSRARICRSVSDRSAITNWTSRNTNAKNVSLPHCNADWMEGELTSSRTRATVAPSGRVWVGGRFCHSKFFAALMAHSITRSEFMREKRTCEGCRSIARHTKIRSNANAVVHQSFGGTSRLHWRSPSMAVEFYFTPELHLRDGRVIRDLEDAISFAREQEARPGVDQRDEVLHRIERAESDEEAHAAAHSFVRWLEELDILE